MAGSGRRVVGLESRLSGVALAFCVAVFITLVGYAVAAATHGTRPSILLKILIPVAFLGPAVETSRQFVLFGALNCALWTLVLYMVIAWRNALR